MIAKIRAYSLTLTLRCTDVGFWRWNSPRCTDVDFGRWNSPRCTDVDFWRWNSPRWRFSVADVATYFQPKHNVETTSTAYWECTWCITYYNFWSSHPFLSLVFFSNSLLASKVLIIKRNMIKMLVNCKNNGTNFSLSRSCVSVTLSSVMEPPL